MKVFKNKKITIVIIIFLSISIFIIPLTLSKYNSQINNTITLNISKPVYTVVFHSNNGSDITSTQNFVYGESQNLNANSFTNGDLTFVGWNTESDGRGDKYTNNQLVNNLSQVNNDVINLYAQWENGVAEVNGTVYKTIHEAIAAVPDTFEETTVKVLTNITLNTGEDIIVESTKNIVFDLENITINCSKNANLIIIENHGKIKITNGTITSSSGQSVINNESDGTLIITGGQIIATGSKQGIYNNGGRLEISGDAYISNTSSNRPAVDNLNSGTIIITGGTVFSRQYYGIRNKASLTVGDKDGIISRTSPSITGSVGINTDRNFSYYDGVIKGRSTVIDSMNYISDTEDDVYFISGRETINGLSYNTIYISDTAIKITFNPYGGTVDKTEKLLEPGNQIGQLPEPTHSIYAFAGWYTEASGGTKVEESTVFDHSIELFARWAPAVASVNGKLYPSLQNAINKVPDNTETTVVILDNITENISIPSRKKIIFDLQSYTISNNGNSAVITNRGYLKIINGTITSDADTAIINNNSPGELVITGGNLLATGSRQTIYNDKGSVTISGTAYLSSVTPERATVHNLASSTMTITGGTIVSANQQAVINYGNLVIGTKDGTINTSSPELIGATYGVTNDSSFNYYDGVIKGVSGAISGSINELEDNSQIVSGSELIDSTTHVTNHLEIVS